VSKKFAHKGLYYVECDIWLENEKGEKTSPGSATVILPAKPHS